MMIRQLNLSPEIDAQETKELIESLSSWVSLARVIVDRGMLHAFSPIANDLLHRISEWCERVDLVREWPGSLLLGPGEMELRTYTATPMVINALIEAGPLLSDWVSPHLPEDLHLIGPRGEVVLGNVAHERDAWVELPEEAWTIWVEGLGPQTLARLRRRDTEP